jgi:hypothetical protein
LLCLTDEALVRILIAGTAIAPDRRSAWLEDLVARLKRAPELPGARYNREWRARERNGQILLRVVVDEVELAVALVDRGLLDPAQADSRAALTRAAERALAQLCRETSRTAAQRFDNIRAGLILALQSKEPPWPTTKEERSSKTR